MGKMRHKAFIRNKHNIVKVGRLSKWPQEMRKTSHIARLKTKHHVKDI